MKNFFVPYTKEQGFSLCMCVWGWIVIFAMKEEKIQIKRLENADINNFKDITI